MLIQISRLTSSELKCMPWFKIPAPIEAKLTPFFINGILSSLNLSER